MRKLEIIQALSESEPPPVLLQATMDYQALSQQLQQGKIETAVFFSSIANALGQIAQQQKECQSRQDQRQAEQDERQAKQDATQVELEKRLSYLESGMRRVMLALPPKVSRDGQLVQPRLAGQEELWRLPTVIWEKKPGLFR